MNEYLHPLAVESRTTWDTILRERITNNLLRGRKYSPTISKRRQVIIHMKADFGRKELSGWHMAQITGDHRTCTHAVIHPYPRTPVSAWVYTQLLFPSSFCSPGQKRTRASDGGSAQWQKVWVPHVTSLASPWKEVALFLFESLHLWISLWQQQNIIYTA
jgi:hypothetical protein